MLRRLPFLFAVLFVTCVMLHAQGSSSQKPPAVQDRESYFRSIVVQRGETVGEVTCIFCSVTIRGTVKGDVSAIWGSVVVEGTVEGDVAAVGGGVRAMPGSHVSGDVAALGGRVHREGDAQIAGEVQTLAYLYFPGQRRLVFPGTLCFIGFNLALALLPLLLLRAKRIQNLNDACHAHPWLAFFLGAILFAAIGYLMSVTEKFGRLVDAADWVLLILLLVLLLPGCAGVSLALGRLLLRGANAFLAVLVGSFALSLLSLVPLFGLVVFLLVWVFALGTTSLARFGFSSVSPRPAEMQGNS